MKFFSSGVAPVFDTVTNPSQLSRNIVRIEPRVQKKGYESMRLSQIDSACPREYTIGHLLGLKGTDSVPFHLKMQFDIGSALHEHVQNTPSFFKKDSLVGYWFCLACGKTRRFGLRPDTPCEHCGARYHATRYQEYMFRLQKPFRVVGKVDVILQVAPGVYRFGDIKSTKDDSIFPGPAETAQIASYMYFYQFDESKNKLPLEIDRSVGYLIYVPKTMSYSKPVLTFPVKPTKAFMEPYIEKARAFTEGVKSRRLPEAFLSCVNTQFCSGPAKNCPMVAYCKKYHDERIYDV